MVKGIIYYTDNRINERIALLVRQRLLATDLPIVSVSRKPIPSFGKNIVLPLERGYLTMFKQILAGLMWSREDTVFLCEHDVLYAIEHFEFTPPREDIIYYNLSNWQVRLNDGLAVYWDCKKVSQICAHRDLLLRHYRQRVEMVEDKGFTRRMGFEPGTHRRAERVDDIQSSTWRSLMPNLDVRHKYNLTPERWRPELFRNKPKNWQQSHINDLPGWESFYIEERII